MEKISFSVSEISCILPHKYPFLLLDKAYDIEPGVSGYGIKNVTMNEWYFQGHFPGNPILPGVMIIEALAQLTAVIYCSEHSEQMSDQSVSELVGYLARTDIKFTEPVVPGDSLILYSKIIKRVSNLMQVKVQAKVEKKIVADGILNVSQKNKERLYL